MRPLFAQGAKIPLSVDKSIVGDLRPCILGRRVEHVYNSFTKSCIFHQNLVVIHNVL